MSPSTPRPRQGRAARIDPIRCSTPLHDRRNAALSRRDELLRELQEVDAALASLADRRAALAARLAELREQLWPTVLHRRGRRPGEDGAADLPPLPASPTWLYGRRLRSVCLGLLRRAGRLTLRHLHALLHLHGFGVDTAHATKALSDALAYEVECGRARRVRRGEYEICGPAPRPGRHGAPPLPPTDPVVDDPLLAEVVPPQPTRGPADAWAGR